MELLSTAASAGEWLTNAYQFRNESQRQAFWRCTQDNGLPTCFGSGGPTGVDSARLKLAGGGGSSLVLGVGLGLGVAFAMRMLSGARSY
jgi:hypothetical protein